MHGPLDRTWRPHLHVLTVGWPGGKWLGREWPRDHGRRHSPLGITSRSVDQFWGYACAVHTGNSEGRLRQIVRRSRPAAPDQTSGDRPSRRIDARFSIYVEVHSIDFHLGALHAKSSGPWRRPDLPPD